MAFGLYKPGQGYWVRVLTAVMAGVVTLAGAGWAWQQVGAVDLPTRGWKMSLTGIPADAPRPAPGAPVTFLAPRGPAAEMARIGGGTIASYEPLGTSQATVEVREVQFDDRRDHPGVVQRVAVPGDAGLSATMAQATAVPVVEPIYVQGAAAGLVIILGAALIYWFVGLRPQSAEFLIATDAEMKKVNWSTWRDIRGSTVVVIVVSFLLAAGLFTVDFLFSSFFRWIGILE